jgi:hypothetical protein
MQGALFISCRGSTGVSEEGPEDPENLPYIIYKTVKTGDKNEIQSQS